MVIIIFGHVKKLSGDAQIGDLQNNRYSEV